MGFLVIAPICKIIVGFLVGIGCRHHNHTRYSAVLHIVFSEAAVCNTIAGFQHQRVQWEYDICIAGDILLEDGSGVAIVWPVVPVITMVVCIIVLSKIKANTATSDFIVDYLHSVSIS